MARGPGGTARPPRPSARERAEDLERLKEQHRFKLRQRALNGGLIVLGIAALWIPLQPVVKIAHELAGKDTQVNLVGKIGITLSLVTSAGWALTFAQSRGRKKELQRVRKRLNKLEGQLESGQSPDRDGKDETP